MNAATPKTPATPQTPAGDPPEPVYEDLDPVTGTPTPKVITPGTLAELLARTDLVEHADALAGNETAGGVAWCDLGLAGIPMINCTERRKTGRQAVDALMSTIQYAYETYGLIPTSTSTYSRSQADQSYFLRISSVRWTGWSTARDWRNVG